MQTSAPAASGQVSSWLRRASAAAAMLLTLTLHALVVEAQQPVQLTAIDVQPLPGAQVELRLRLSGPAPEPMSFTIDNPARISLDLPNTTLALPQRRQDVNVGPVTTVLSAEANGRTRVVLNMNQLVPYQTRVEGDSVYVTIGQAPGAAPQPSFAAQTPRSGAPAAQAPAAAGERAIRNIDFRRGADGAGQVVVALSDPRTTVDVRQEGGRIVVEFQNTTLPQELLKRLDVTDFATPVYTIDALRSNRDARLVVTAAAEYDQVAYQADNVFTLELKPPAPKATSTGPGGFDQNREYTGQRFSMNFQDIETRAALQLIADYSNLNIVASDTVQGSVTLRLQNVPWDQALDIVMTTKGLDMQRNGNVIIVAPAEEIAAREQADLQAQKALQTLEPLRSEFIQVNYAKASELADLIRGGGGGGGGTNRMISERGSVAIDVRTNTLLVQDTASSLANIRRLVTTLDIPVRQVQIETRVVIVNDDYSRELGVRFGTTVANGQANGGLIGFSGSDIATDNIINAGSGPPTNIPPLGSRYNVNLPVGNPAGSFSLSILDPSFLVDLELSALQAEGAGRIVSTPRVVATNQRQATIEQGVQIPYQEASSSGATTTQFKDAVLSLTVTPQITPDDKIIMDLEVTKDSVGEVVPSATGGFVPSIDTRKVVSTAVVSDGETVVLGGIYETEIRDTYTKVPVLGDIPGLGYLFRSRNNVNNNAELLIFVTPKIIREGSRLE